GKRLLQPLLVSMPVTGTTRHLAAQGVESPKSSIRGPVDHELGSGSLLAPEAGFLCKRYRANDDTDEGSGGGVSETKSIRYRQAHFVQTRPHSCIACQAAELIV